IAAFSILSLAAAPFGHAEEPQPFPSGVYEFVLASPADRATTPDVRVVRGGTPLTVSNPGRVADLFVAVVESSSVNSTKSVSPKRRWDAASSAPALVHVKFPGGRVLR